jgi:hypothetical protein
MKAVEAKEKVEFESGPLTVGAVLVGVGGLLAFIGAIIAGLHLLGQAVRWVASWEQPPTEIAKANWGRVRAAGQAGASAWKDAAEPISARS